MCNCHPDVTSADNGQTIAFDPPSHMKAYGERRDRALTEMAQSDAKHILEGK